MVGASMVQMPPDRPSPRRAEGVCRVGARVQREPRDGEQAERLQDLAGPSQDSGASGRSAPGLARPLQQTHKAAPGPWPEKAPENPGRRHGSQTAARGRGRGSKKAGPGPWPDEALGHPAVGQRRRKRNMEARFGSGSTSGVSGATSLKDDAETSSERGSLRPRNRVRFRLSGSDFGRGADDGGPDLIRRIGWGPPSSALWPKSEPDRPNPRLSAPLWTTFRLQRLRAGRRRSPEASPRKDPLELLPGHTQDLPN